MGVYVGFADGMIDFIENRKIIIVLIEVEFICDKGVMVP